MIKMIIKNKKIRYKNKKKPVNTIKVIKDGLVLWVGAFYFGIIEKLKAKYLYLYYGVDNKC